VAAFRNAFAKAAKTNSISTSGAEEGILSCDELVDKIIVRPAPSDLLTVPRAPPEELGQEDEENRSRR